MCVYEPWHECKLALSHTRRPAMFKKMVFGALTGALFLAGAASAQELKIALIAGKTGPLEAYAKDTEKGFMLGLEYLTNGSMARATPELVVPTAMSTLSSP